MGANFAVFWDGDVVASAFAEAGDVDGGVEFAELADGLSSEIIAKYSDLTPEVIQAL